MKKLNICIITPKKYPVPATNGGAVEGLVEMFLDENEKQKKINITVVSVFDKYAEEKAKKYNHSNLIYIHRKKRDWFSENRIVNFINRYFVRHYSKPFMSQGYISRVVKSIRHEEKKKNCKFDFFVVEDGEYDIYYPLIKYAGKEKVAIHLHGITRGEKTVDNWFSHYLCVSDFVGRKLVEDGIISTQKVDVIKNALNIEKFVLPDNYDRNEFRKKYHIEEDDFVLMYWGRIVPEKGIREAVGVYKRLREEGEKVKLVVIGGAEFAIKNDKTEFESELSSIVEGDNGIIFTGFIPNNQIKDVIGMADVAIMLSLCDETAGLSILEAALMSVPVITMPNGGIPEYVDENSAIYIRWSKNIEQDVANKIKILISNSEYYSKFTQSPQRYVEKYNSSTYYHRYIELMEKYC